MSAICANRKTLASTVLVSGIFCLGVFCAQAEDTFNVGWIGPMTGVAAKYAAWESVQIARDEINASGGISGKQVRLIAEDGQCNAATAVTTARKLIDVDKVKILIGGHCSSETLAIATVVKDRDILQLAALSSSPLLSGIGPSFFRLTTPATISMVDLASSFAKTEDAHNFAVLNEQTEYCIGETEAFASAVTELFQTQPVLKENFLPGTVDFRTILQRIRAKKVKYLFISAQGPDTSEMIIRQLAEQRTPVRLIGGAVLQTAVRRVTWEGLKGFLSLDFSVNKEHPRTMGYIQELRSRFHINEPPMGQVTAEAYDELYLLKESVERCGSEVSQIVKCLQSMPEFSGVSGRFRFNENHDPTRTLNVVKWNGVTFETP